MGIVVFDDDSTTTPALVQSTVEKHPLSAVVAIASFAPQCQQLLEDLKKGTSTTNAGCCGGKSYEVIVLDELEDLAIDLGMKDIPSYQIYKNGRLIETSPEGSTVTAEKLFQALDRASAAVSCCGNPNEQPPMDASEVLRLVATSYANTVNQVPGGCCVSVDPNLNAYDAAELAKAGALEANLGLGCGNPLTFSNLQPGETVVDLGSGGGIDCFLASEKVGPSGKVIGVDMTPDMLLKARQTAKKRLQDNPELHNNVTFRLGEIEYLPLADNSVDCIISNCVINLSPNKPQVYREMYRALKPGGRIAISDVVNRPQMEIPDRLKTAQALAC